MNDSFNSGEFNKDLDEFYNAALEPVELLTDERYTDEEFIASGAIKSVYKVTDNHCARDVALARIKENIFNSSQALDFIREVQVTSSLEHPNIIRVYDIGIKDSAPWFTMELTSSQTLADYIKAHPDLSLNDKLDTFLQLCDAIAYAHENDILHLDLKPENVTIGIHNQVLLCDWGISSSISNLPEKDLEKLHTRYGYIKGSPGYMAPEQATVDYKKQPAADIFGLGAILHFLLTSHAPVTGRNTNEILENTKAGNIHILQDSSIPPRLQPVLQSALAKNPSDRYPSARKLKNDIQAFRDGFATFAEEPSLYTILTLFIKRNRVATLVTVFLVAVLISLTSYYIRSLKLSEAREITARKNAEAAKNQTEVTLNALLKEQQARLKANEEFSQLLVLNNRSNLSDFNFDQALKDAKKALQRSPNNSDAQLQLGFTHFLRFEFSEAANYLTQSNREMIMDLKDIAISLEAHDGSLSGEEVIHLFQQTTNNRLNLKSFMLHYYAKSAAQKDLLKVVLYLLAERNVLSEIKYTYDAKTKSLNLQGNPEVRAYHVQTVPMVSGYCILAPLKLKELIIDDSQANRNKKVKLEAALNCPIRLLNMTGSR